MPRPSYLLLVLSLALSGCFRYPIFRNIQPTGQVTVQDKQSYALHGVRVPLISNA